MSKRMCETLSSLWVLTVAVGATGCGIGSGTDSSDVDSKSASVFSEENRRVPSGIALGDSARLQGEKSLQYPYTIVTTCGMVSDIVRVVAGKHGKVAGLMGQGVDPHLYKPTRNDVKQLMDGDIVFYSGLMLEGRMTDTFSKVARQGKRVFPVTEEIDESYLREPSEFEGHWDPHVWMDVSAWSQCVSVVAKALAGFDPEHADAYESNKRVYQNDLKSLDDYIKKTIGSIPQDERVLVTAHDAFGYFGRAYGIEVRSVQGLSTDSEAGVKDIEDLIQFLVERQVKAVFFESSVSQKNIQAVIEGAAEKEWGVEVGGELFSDAMGKPGTYRGTYMGMMDHNATTITRALDGSAPQGGWRGKLAAGDH